MIALLVLSAMIIVPLGPVPFTMQTAVVILCVLVLTPKEACVAVGGYLVLGTLGLPIFSGLRGGFGVIAGPTGGFLIGFLLGAAAAALLRQAFVRRGHTFVGDIVAAVVVLAISYLLGWAQLALVAHMGFGAAFMVGVAPFVILDVVKAAVAIGLAGALRKAVPALIAVKSR